MIFIYIYKKREREKGKSTLTKYVEFYSKEKKGEDVESGSKDLDIRDKDGWRGRKYNFIRYAQRMGTKRRR